MLYSHPPFYIDSHNVCVFEIQCHTHTPTNTHQATAQVYLPQSALWLWEQQVNTSLLYKQVGATGASYSVFFITVISGEEYSEY